VKVKQEFLFWVIIGAVLTLLFNRSLNGLQLSFYFVSFLLPIIISTSLFFNYYLVPKYLLKDRKLKFGLYFTYLIIVSVYLEMLVIVMAFVILADYQIENLGSLAGDIYLLTIILYLIVFGYGLILILKSWKEKDQRLTELEQKNKLNERRILTVRVNRKNAPIELDKITYIESLSDYIQIHTVNESFITKEKISSISEKLPDWFIRIHRSFIVNKHQITSYNKEIVFVAEKELPIGRKYKNQIV
jgi:two-component system, LytTR family, response regulator LytT